MLTTNLDLKIFLYILIIIFFLFFIVLLMKMISFFSKLDSILKNSKTEIEESIIVFPNLVKDTSKILEKTNINLEKLNLLLDDANSIIKDSKKNIIDSSTNISSALENIKNISTNVADSTKLVTKNFINRAFNFNRNSNTFLNVLDVTLEGLEIFKTHFKKDK